ncbi:hypothetical protein RISK_003017 [Rhodopirellula islandica]|uniref:Uncharacterized protein n=1 Tax=Rhodopirellula islandica TaxID=595434 RepID=A0A0J1EGT1_RHOIS|nr:hypothetical protein RISK_003017 [Rhodopirellula islandica]
MQNAQKSYHNRRKIRKTPVEVLQEKRRAKRRNPTGKRIRRDGTIGGSGAAPKFVNESSQPDARRMQRTCLPERRRSGLIRPTCCLEVDRGAAIVRSTMNGDWWMAPSGSLVVCHDLSLG